MLSYRTFRNTDPPYLAALWRSRAGAPGILQHVTPDLLEQLVFAKLYFDYDGLWLAFDDGRAVGFAHAGFGPNAEQNWISTETGVVCILVTCPDCDQTAVADGLLERCEEYLCRRGACTIYGGCRWPCSPFYLGLYGGSELPGVLDTDKVARQALADHGYQEIERATLFRRDLSGFEWPIDRQQMQVRRQMMVEATIDAPTKTWWEAAAWGQFDLTRFELVPRSGGRPVATATFRDMEPVGTTTVGRAAGLLDTVVEEPYRRRGLAVFLLSEAFRQFLRQGIMHVETLVRQDNVQALDMLDKLGFQPVGQAGLWCKQL